jgi:endonuclease/exonuclease/phosphatase family metal-dependent hydrolase
VDVIKAESPSIICVQELREDQDEYMRGALDEFAWHGLAEEPCSGHRPNCILYRRDTFTLKAAGGYWLSDTPHVAGSRSWDSACIRLANWVQLVDNGTGAEFRVVNTHLDHVSQQAREEQARLLVEDASVYPADYPQILTGDMNSDVRNRSIAVLKQGGWTDTHELMHGPDEPGPTLHDFLGPEYKSTTGKIDWIFYRGGMDVVAAEIIKDTRDNRFPSDHYFASATLNLHTA